MRLGFLPSTPPSPGGMYLPAIHTGWAPGGWRSAAVSLAAVLAALLHGLLLTWYLNRPQPLSIVEAAPLPMIDLALAAPPAPPVTQPKVPPPPVPPKEAKKPDPKPMRKPKPQNKVSAIKQIEPQKPEPETAPPAPPSAPAPIQDRAAAPRKDTFTPASSNADYLNNPKPVYPGVARSRHWEGLVYLRVYVTADGQVAEVNVQRPSGHEVLDDSAVEAVRKWRFVPAKRGELTQASWVTVPIEFELE